VKAAVLIFAGVFSFAWQSGVSAAPEADLWHIWQASDETNAAAIDHAPWQRFLDRYVERDAASNVHLVRYGAVTAADSEALRQYLNTLQSTDPRVYRRDEQLAFWINLYNAATVDIVLRNPDKRSILRMGGGLFNIGPWDQQLLEIADIAVTLNDIEHRILRPIWRDRRIHFAVNCASMGCPNLDTTAYTSENVDRLLSANERAYINDPRGARFDANGRLYLSRIFDWYAVDFAATQQGLLEYLAGHADAALASRLRSYDGKIRYDYDWALNAAP
jgi:Protein of unknown function, DUF547